jgi:hypothetical protein
MCAELKFVRGTECFGCGNAMVWWTNFNSGLWGNVVGDFQKLPTTFPLDIFTFRFDLPPSKFISLPLKHSLHSSNRLSSSPTTLINQFSFKSILFLKNGDNRLDLEAPRQPSQVPTFDYLTPPPALSFCSRKLTNLT